MKRSNFIAVVIALISTLAGFAQNPTNSGKEFWVAYGHHQFMETGTNTQEMVLYFNAIGQPATVKVSINGTNWYRTWNIPANGVISTASATPVAGFPTATPTYIPKLGFYDCRMYDLAPPAGTGGEGLYTRGIHIESDVPIVAYAHTFGSASSGATMLMPVETWGYSYVSVNSIQQYASNCFSWAYVVAQQNNTVVEITPSVLTRNNHLPNVPFTVTLNKGEVYQVIGANTTGGSTSLEVTGTKFRSIANGAGVCYPVAVFSGSSRTSNPISCGSGGGDNDNQQLFPTMAWGKRFLTAPTSRSTAPNQFMRNSYKVVTKDPTTKVYKNGTQLMPYPANFYFFESNTADLIESDKPIMIAQFMTGGACMGGGEGDPEMIIISPLEQGSDHVGFFRNNAESINTNYLTLIVPNRGTGLSSLTIDGVAFSALPAAVKHSYPHPQNPNYTVIVRRWTGFAAYPAPPPGQCIVKCDSVFTAITYGLGSVESYGYNAGTMIKNLSAVSSIQNTLDPTTPQHKFTCINTPVKLSVLMAYPPTYMEWNLSALAPSLSPSTNVVDNAPVPVETIVINGITYYKYSLPNTYQFSTADTFMLPITARHPSVEACNNTETLYVPIIVKDKPKADFTTTYTNCTLDTAYLNGVTTTTDGFTLNTWNWTLPGPATATGKDIKPVLAPGTHNIQLSVVTAEGCASDTIKSITVNAKPTTAFTNAPLTICEGTAVSFTPTSSYATPASLNQWYWDFGDGVTTSAATGADQSHSYNGYGSFTVKQVVKYGPLCISDTATRIINVFAKPVISFTYPVGCLPVGDVAQFTGDAIAPDGQTIPTHNWNFGDANATPANPNTSTLQNPSHIYSTFGNYTITYSATTSNGCTKDSVKTLTFDVRPQLAFTSLTSICENAAPVTFTSGSVTNAVPGTHKYKGPGIDASGVFHPDIAGPGTHQIWYVFTSNAGCMDSLPQNILVYAKPLSQFTLPAGCLASDGMAQFTNTSTISDGQALTYLWNFGDANASSANPNTANTLNASHIFKEGSYQVSLQVRTANGCLKDSIVSITFGVTPALTVAPIASICQNPNAALIPLTFATVTNGVTGTGVYSGPGTNAQGSFDPNVAGFGVHNLLYTFTSAGGCTQTANQTIEVYPRPQSTFTATQMSSCLGDNINISSNATIPSGTVTTWNWNLGDSRTPSYTNGNAFNITYPTANNYTIKLVTVSDRGCLSNESTVTVGVHPLPVANFTLPTGICMPNGQAVFTNTSTTPDNSTLSYQWNFGDGSGPSTATNPSHVYGSIGSYNVSLITTTSFGCKDTSDTKTLSDFYDKPVAQFQVSPQELCQGENTLFIDQSTAPNSTIKSWNWNFGDGTSSTTQTPVKQFPNQGNYNISLAVTNAVGCVSDPLTKAVVVHLQPKIDAGRSFTVPQGTSIEFEGTANSGNLNLSWTPASGLSDATILRPKLVAMQDQRYVLTAIGDFGCTATDYLDVKILRPVTVPNVFSPNGDGLHDKWVIPNLMDYSNCQVEVFNRYGQSVFYSIGYGTSWDGKLKGNELPVGVYYYVIRLENGFKPLTGSLTIVR